MLASMLGAHSPPLNQKKARDAVSACESSSTKEHHQNFAKITGILCGTMTSFPLPGLV